METGMLHLHNLLRWVILILILVTLYMAIRQKASLSKFSLWLMISSHLMLIIGLYQVIAGRYGIIKGLPQGESLMNNTFYRFYWIEHPVLMLVAIILITVAHRKAKNARPKSVILFLLFALLCILVAMPWPFRMEGIGRPWFPGM
ncbi:MAG: hypothetical protein N2747_00645 [Chitinophagaceae bacterium]|nr:hypothetical protein [Chitinophagaceae bacterium]